MKYICESCDNVVVDETSIKKCVECGDEICVHCAEGMYCDECAEEAVDYTYPNGFAKFGTGEGAVRASDDEIKEWLNEVKRGLVRSDSKIEHSLTGSGNTMVFGFKYEDEYVFYVAKNYEEISIFPDEVEVDEVKF